MEKKTIDKAASDKNNQSLCIILSNGSFPSHEVPLSFLRRADYIVCCDGAANQFIAHGGVPDAIVGDGDSLSEENKKRYRDRFFEDNDLNTNDLTKSIKFCISQGMTNIVILAATGKRDDHSLGNISLLADYMQIADVKMVTDYGIFIPISSNTSFESFKGQQVSIFSIDNALITTYHLKYPLQSSVLTNWWQGTLNESCGESFSIKTTGKVIVFQAF